MLLQLRTKGNPSFVVCQHKVPPAYSHADENACSLTAVGMTIFRTELCASL
jgi:hypothetical protein